ncbi:unnamed protein product [Blumeria hordei]|uniref:Large ribosomal subunit protein mL67 n=2 Tax=Blumeria hordei TaxID=2867405 RepID=A0A383UVW9_BLUHO|nr:hypothetical protein BGHDH14_bgh05297 [Blumeria hordei DH14]SZF03866.1 unnamed protein product [Blumeria hordei]
MRLLKATEIARRAAQALKDAKQTVTVKKKKRSKKTPFEGGQQIFIFSHIQRNLVAYSLSRALNACRCNNETLRFIPYNGKKTVPSALRKDLWSPFATISFPKGCGNIGRSVFQKLREYRRRHEHEWGEEITINPENGYFIAKKKRARKLCDQVANSVADMAYVLGRLDVRGPDNSDEKNELSALSTTTPSTQGISEQKSIVSSEAKSAYQNIGLVGEGTGKPVQIHWRDIRMAEFAQSWSNNVEHGILPWQKNYRDNDIANAKKQLRKEGSLMKREPGKEKKREGLSTKQVAKQQEGGHAEKVLA